MIGWLRNEREEPQVEVAGRMLPIEVRRDARARRLTVRLVPDGSAVRLTLPRWCPQAEGVAFVHARTDWLSEQLAKVPCRRPPEPGGTLFYRGHELTISWCAGAPRTPVLELGAIALGGPRERVAARLQGWLESEAQRLMAHDLDFFAARAGLAPPRLALSRAQRRWGSCSTSGTVRINWRLIQAPDAVRRSVVAHEIAHCLHFDHSPAFHSALGRIFDGEIAAADAWLKAHGRGLYASFG